MRRLLLLLLVAALAGCGGDGGGDDGDLVRFLPADAPVIAAVDLEAARAELDLPEDAAPFDRTLVEDGSFDPQSPEGDLLSAASLAVPTITSAVQRFQFDDPLLAAIDGTRLTAAAATLGSDEVVGALRTGQPFADIAAALEDEEWTRDGDVLTGPDDARFDAVADAGDGVVLVGAGVDLAALLEDPPGGPEAARELLEPADASVRVATTFEDGCLTAAGGWQAADGATGTFRVAVDGEADPERVDTAGLPDALELDEPRTDGSVVDVAFTAPADLPTSLPVRDVLQRAALPALYECG